MTDDTTQTTVSIERRAKKHVRSRTHTWMAVCAPGLEQVLRAELADRGFTPAPEEIRGGVEFAGRLEDGMRANLVLRTASRILVRVATFKARAIEDVFRETTLIPWEAWLPAGCALDIQPTIHSSRIESPTLLQNTVSGAINRRFAQDGLPVPRILDVAESQKILARLDEDRLTLSLDSSGDLLHRRGWRSKSVAAPMRETLAAAILLAAGYDGTEPLVDAMCGSGTFAIEAALIAARVPPGDSAKLPRDFAFAYWPAFPAAAWNHMVAHEMAESRSLEALSLLYPSLPTPEIANFARDIDPLAIAAARDNAESSAAAGLIEFAVADFFATPPPCPSGLIVMNPPYGLRLDAGASPAALYRRIARTLQSSWQGWRYAVVMPDAGIARQWPLPVECRLDFAHGGLDAVAVIGKID